MSATPKHVRKESKKIEKSIRKDRPISLKNASKQMVKKHAKSSAKINSSLEKKHKK
jgi:hypothetical protein